MTIKEARIEDLEEVAKLFDAYRVFYKQSSDMEAAKAFINERIELEESVIFVAEAQNGAIAYNAGFTQLYPFFTSVGMSRKWVLNDLFVHPDFRRMGVARKLMETAIDFARSTGASGLALETAIDNGAAQPLYEALGFVKDTEYYHYDLKL
ncbi:MAG: GNAT family N-acetyltransferase [Bacteroidota bacterium]